MQYNLLIEQKKFEENKIHLDKDESVLWKGIKNNRQSLIVFF